MIASLYFREMACFDQSTDYSLVHTLGWLHMHTLHALAMRLIFQYVLSIDFTWEDQTAPYESTLWSEKYGKLNYDFGKLTIHKYIDWLLIEPALICRPTKISALVSVINISEIEER
jgi:hypothetical protein